jgi:hypothetical protein
MSPLSLLAYIDPVSGSILLQAIIAAFIGGVAFFRKSLWGITNRFFSKKSKSDTDKETDS